jgi:hypothetical protein
MDQLGNIHEAGLLLAEARERAAKAETEAEFLRERLGEIRIERDELKKAASIERPSREPAGPQPTPAPPKRPTGWEIVRRWWRGS